MSKKEKPQWAWFQRNVGGILLPASCSWSRRGCIEKVQENYGPHWPWKNLYRLGHRIVRVKLVQR